MKTDTYTLAGYKAELVNMLCRQYIEKLLLEGRISEEHAELLSERFRVKYTENGK